MTIMKTLFGKDASDVKAASLELVAMQPGSYLMLYVVVATALSFAIPHMMYLRSH